jgi:hypothetical protein
MSAQQVSETSIHNAHLLDRLRAATLAAQELSRKGFVLAGVDIGARNPVVWVEHTRACESLPAGALLTNPYGTVMASAIEGAQVQWMVRRLVS